ncbi:MAG TPA: hypothetical protein VIJ32_10815 [Actinomycetes bacterium]
MARGRRAGQLAPLAVRLGLVPKQAMRVEPVPGPPARPPPGWTPARCCGWSAGH